MEMLRVSAFVRAGRLEKSLFNPFSLSISLSRRKGIGMVSIVFD